jgi:hypothetical protein
VLCEDSVEYQQALDSGVLCWEHEQEHNRKSVEVEDQVLPGPWVSVLKSFKETFVFLSHDLSLFIFVRVPQLDEQIEDDQANYKQGKDESNH